MSHLLSSILFCLFFLPSSFPSVFFFFCLLFLLFFLPFSLSSAFSSFRFLSFALATSPQVFCRCHRSQVRIGFFYRLSHGCFCLLRKRAVNNVTAVRRGAEIRPWSEDARAMLFEIAVPEPVIAENSLTNRKRDGRGKQWAVVHEGMKFAVFATYIRSGR